jgi:hypothetical protein
LDRLPYLLSVPTGSTWGDHGVAAKILIADCAMTIRRIAQ